MQNRANASECQNFSSSPTTPSRVATDRVARDSLNCLAGDLADVRVSIDASRRHEFSPAFQRRDHAAGVARRVATIESALEFLVSLRDTIYFVDSTPSLERPG